MIGLRWSYVQLSTFTYICTVLLQSDSLDPGVALFFIHQAQTTSPIRQNNCFDNSLAVYSSAEGSVERYDVQMRRTSGGLYTVQDGSTGEAYTVLKCTALHCT